ncbi:protein ripply3 [Sapajus apella]|uniref:Protein ripply3 n=2 Tax=Cebidae TaxID=9498 RepID=A0A6J3HRS9_SAPAP|nr:protein ripply3 [Sapajus apella]
MEPKAAAGDREARGRVCHCPGDGPRRPPPQRVPESPELWRPWIQAPEDDELTRTESRLAARADQHAFGSKGAFGFQHPVRLYLPMSKRQEYLQSSGMKVLASFPVQATIHFYNDEATESASEAEESEEGPPPLHLPPQEAGGLQEKGPGGKDRDQGIN